MNSETIQRELQQLRAYVIEKTSHLEKELGLVKGPAPRKGKEDNLQRKIDRRNRRMGR